MKLTCNACRKAVDLDTSGWPGDVVKCPHCAADIELPKLATVMYSPGTAAVALSPSGEQRPETLGDDEVLPPGTMLGQYRIESFVGRGGMGSVYRATHDMLHRTVAVKVLPPKFARDEEFVGRFRREALALAGLAHPNIVAIHDMGRQGEIHFLVMEFVEGANLRDLLVARRIPPEEALKIVPQLCDALEYAHAQGVIHRDIKPENIMLDRNGQAKIADFGLAKMVKGEKGGPSLTQTNVVMGTVEYMAPEQRDNMKSVDHRADIYSLGVVLYEMLTGELPVGRFDLPSHKVMVDVRVDEVVLKALEREPGRRYQRASQMGTDVSQMRMTKPAPADLPILDLATGKAVGTAVGRAFVVRSEDTPVRIDMWPREEIGLQIGGPYILKTDQQPAVLQARSDSRSLTVFLPKGSDLDLSAKDGEVQIGGFSGRLSAQVHDGGLTATDLEGRIAIVGADGDVTISGLKGEEIDVRTSDGSVTVGRLHLVRGQASFAAHDGDVTVNLAPDGSLRYQMYSGGGGVSHPAGGTGDEHTAAGTIGSGAATLSIRTHDGEARLTSGGALTFNAEALRDIWKRLTPKQREKLGVYVIVCAALWAATPIFGTIVPALATTVFWGMAIALDLWKQYVRGGYGPQGAHAPPVMIATAADAFPKSAGNPQGMPAPANAPPSRRVSALAVFAILSAGLAALPAAALVFMRSVDWGTFLDGDADAYWAAIASLSFASLVTGLASLAFGLATFTHVRESGGRLLGKAGAFIALASGLIAVFLAAARGFPAVDAAREAGLQAGAVRKVVEDSIRSGKPETMWELVVREGLDEKAFQEAHAAVVTAIEDAGRTMVVRQVTLSPRLERASVHVWYGSTSTRIFPDNEGVLELARSHSTWRIANPIVFLKELERNQR